MSLNILPKECIYRNLDSKYKENLLTFGDRLLGTFIVGIANYGYATKVSDIKYITIYFPTFLEMCTKPPKYEQNENETLIDIRIVYKIFDEDPFALLEVLFSDYYCINNIYKETFNKFFYNEREKIAKADKYSRISKAYSRAKEAYDRGDIFEAVRLYYGAAMYVRGISCYECFHPSDPMILGLFNYIAETGNYDTNNLFTEFEKILNSVPKEKNESVKNLFKEGILALVSLYLSERVSIDTFVEQLTAKEKELFEFLLKSGDGLYSITQLTEDTGISRITFSSLFKKMNDSNVAEIKSHGAKGTSIKWKGRDV